MGSHGKTRDEPSWVYFAVNESFDRVKIGVSGDPDARLMDLQVGSPERLGLYGRAIGDAGLEGYWHRLLAEHRTHGEWFRFRPCKDQIDAWLDKPRVIEQGSVYSLFEFRGITLLTTRTIRVAERLAYEAGVTELCGCRDQDGTAWSLYDKSGNIRGSVWLDIVSAGCLSRALLDSGDQPAVN